LFVLSSKCLLRINNGGIERTIPRIKKGINTEVPKYISRRSQTLLKIKIEATINTSSHTI